MSAFLVSMLAAADPQRGGRRDVSVAEVLDSGAQEASTSLADDPRIQAQMLTTIAQTDYTLGRFREGSAAATAAIVLLEKQPRAAEQLAEALRLNGKLLNEIDDRNAAQVQLQRALDVLRQVPNSERAQAVLLKELGMTRFRELKPEVAESLYREAIAIFARLHVDDAEYGDTLVSLGELLLRKSRFAEALRVEQQGLEMMLRHQDPTNPDVLGARLAVAEALESLGRYGEAEPILRGLVADRQRVLGSAHLDTLIAELSLSANLRMRGQYRAAAALAEAVSEQLDPQLDAQHKTRLFALSTRGLAQCLDGRGEGLAAVEEAARIRLARFGEHDPRASMGRALTTVCRSALGQRIPPASALAADEQWRPLACGSYSDVPALMAKATASGK